MAVRVRKFVGDYEEHNRYDTVPVENIAEGSCDRRVSMGVTPSYRELRQNRELLGLESDHKGRDSINRDLARRLVDSRPFIAWDGEGYNDAAGRHHYMLFGASTGDEVFGESLGTSECLELLLRVEAEHPDTYHVIFAGNYDVNMFLRDVPTAVLRQLKTTGACYWRGYKLAYIKSKMFRVSRGKVSVTLYDVFTFFACSFVKALGEYLGTENADVQRIIAGKKGRDAFQYGDMTEVKEYFRTELKYLVILCNKLRDYLHTAGIHISKWHGPGAVASSVLNTRKLKRLQLPEAVHTAGQCAYYGGRFEPFGIGTYYGPVWEYDIRSAYPAAIATLPRLGNDWHYVLAPESCKPFAMYRVMYHTSVGSTRQPHPFPWRHRTGAVFYPPTHGGTWTWGVEVISAIKHAPGTVTVLEGWEYDDDGERPYQWIADMYRQRAEWKTAGIQAQLALKLAMNSIYGKLAQQVGWKVVKGILQLPAFHQIEYAGYVTAYARAQLYAAMMQKPSSLIAVETDAVYTREPLRLDVGPGLGQWKETLYEGVIYVQSGMYFARGSDGVWKHRTRGFGRGDIDVDRLLDWLGNIRHAEDAYSAPEFRVEQRRFKTMGTSLGKDDWRTWKTEFREIHVGTPGGKREHYGPGCAACESDAGSLAEVMHDLVPALSLRGIDYSVPSTPYKLEWQGADRPTWTEEGEPWEAVYE